jgi:hypothetical protein
MTDDLAPPETLVDPDPDPVVALARLADVAGHAATTLLDYRRDHPDAPDLPEAIALGAELDRRAVALRTQAVALLGERVAEAVAQLKDATQRIDAFLSEVKTAQARLDLAGAVIALAGAALSGDAAGLLDAASKARETLVKLQAADKPAA